MIGTTVSHYRILDRLGGGGMGVVYRAEDLSLKRTVALKFLPPELLRDDGAKERFRREAQAASAIDHANVCTIFEIGETDDGRLFIAMAHYAGETLAHKIERGPLPIDEAVACARQIARGLQAAHRQGVLHRDVKPANVFVTDAGEVKLLDFGLAKVLDEVALTDTGTSLGTPTYMAPEQISGRQDARSDVWALGVVLYEMLTGRRPFSGVGPAALYAVLHQAPAPIQDLRPGAPGWLQDVVDKALAKDPGERYGSAAEIAADLGASGSQGAVTAAFPSPPPAVRGAPGGRPGRRPLAAVAIAVLALAVLAGLVFVTFRHRRAGEAPVRRPAAAGAIHGDVVAVFPFSYRGQPDSAYLGEGMVDLLSAKLDGTGTLRAVDPRALLAYLAHESTSAVDPAEGVRLAGRFDASHFLLGNIVELGGNIRLDASLYASAGSSPVESAKASAEGDVGELFALVDSVAAQLLVAHLGVADDELVQLASLTTHSFAALRSYLEGESAFRAGRIEASADALERAVALDPEFALAWYRLGHVKEFQFETEAARRAAAEAARHAGRLSERHRLLVEALNLASHDAASEADRLFRRILRRYPASVEAWYGWGELLFHCGPLTGEPLAAALEPWEKMLALEPKSAVAALHLARIALANGDTSRLGELTERMVEILGRDDEREILLFRAELARSDAAEERLLAALRGTEASSVRWLLTTGLPYVKTRADVDRAERRVELLLEPSRSSAEQAFGERTLAILDAARGRFGEARRRLAAAGPPAAAYEEELAPLLVTLPFLSPRPEDLTELAGVVSGVSASEAPVREDLSPPAAVAAHLRWYQLGLLQAGLGENAAALRSADLLQELEGHEAELACLGGDLARGVRAAVAWRRGEAAAVLAELAGRRCECGYQTALATPLVSQVRERFLEAEALAAVGREEEALPVYESLSEGGIYDVIYLAPAHARQGRIHAERGELEAAREHLARFVELWADGDAEVRPAVDAARRRLAELED